MNELYGVDHVIYPALTGDAALTALVASRIYADIPPEGARYPMVLFTFQSGIDRSAVGAAARIFTKPLYQIKAVVQNDPLYAIAGQIADRIDKIMEGLTGRVTVNGVTYTVDGCTREQPIRYVETADGVIYRHVGGLYRLFTYPLAGA